MTLDAMPERRQPTEEPRPNRPREADFRVDAQGSFEVAVIRYGDWDKIGILVTQRSGIGMEAVLTPRQAEQLAGHLLKQLGIAESWCSRRTA